jgi:mevalonate kinase
MPAISATAPGKIILFGEHAVVYGRPAIAVPIDQVRVRVAIFAQPRAESGSVRIQAPDINLDARLDELPVDHPIVFTINQLMGALGISHLPACTIRISSTIPVASGLGSGAAVSIAALKALSDFLGRPLPDDKVNQLAYEVETLHHGTPSGIDNTVITYVKPVFFLLGEPIKILRVPMPFKVLIGVTGIIAPTTESVADVRRGWEENPVKFEAIFDEIGEITESARGRIEGGEPNRIGNLMNANHKLLQKMDVSSSELDGLVAAARDAGALGAKMSGGGRGGNMIALVTPDTSAPVSNALLENGAVRIIVSEIKNNA